MGIWEKPYCNKTSGTTFFGFFSPMGPIDTLSICCLIERLEHFKNRMGLSRFFSFKMFYLMGWDGMGWGGVGDQKCPLIFFILRYIKHYTHINLYIYKKMSRQISCGFKIWTSWGSG